MSKQILIAYYSRTGNTEEIAKIIQNETGGELFAILPEKPYPNSYNQTTSQAKKEIRKDYKPPLKTDVEDMSSYRTIFIGTPNWWSTIAPPVATFLDKYNFSGKKIVPFYTHGGSGKGRIVKAIGKLCPQAEIVDEFSKYSTGLGDMRTRISNWLDESDLI